MTCVVLVDGPAAHALQHRERSKRPAPYQMLLWRCMLATAFQAAAASQSRATSWVRDRFGLDIAGSLGASSDMHLPCPSPGAAAIANRHFMRVLKEYEARDAAFNAAVDSILASRPHLLPGPGRALEGCGYACKPTQEAHSNAPCPSVSRSHGGTQGAAQQITRQEEAAHRQSTTSHGPFGL